MIVVRDPAEVRRLAGPFAAAVGVFDGIHLGHRAVFAELRAAADAAGASTIVVTFDPHPAVVVRPDAAPLLLTTADERLRLLEAEGLDAACVVRFDRETAGLTAEGFLDRWLPAEGALRVLAIGHDFRMGKGRAAGYEELLTIGERRGFQVLRVGPRREGGETISSSRIREVVRTGDVAAAARMLGRPYGVEGRVVPGRGIGRTLQFPTANVDVADERKLLPPHGVYAAWADLGDEQGARWAVVNRGVRPTFGATDPVLEVHVPGFEGDLRGRLVRLELVERIRPEITFPGPEELAARIRADLVEARRILGVEPDPATP